MCIHVLTSCLNMVGSVLIPLFLAGNSTPTIPHQYSQHNIIDAEQLLPSHPDCAKEARAYPAAFNDLLKKVKHALCHAAGSF